MHARQRQNERRPRRARRARGVALAAALIVGCTRAPEAQPTTVMRPHDACAETTDRVDRAACFVRRLRDEAHARRDVVKLSCIQERLVALEALRSRDAIAIQQALALEQQASECVGELMVGAQNEPEMPPK